MAKKLRRAPKCQVPDPPAVTDRPRAGIRGARSRRADRVAVGGRTQGARDRAAVARGRRAQRMGITKE